MISIYFYLSIYLALYLKRCKFLLIQIFAIWMITNLNFFS